jgi:two-component sensor histidine kinase
MSRLIVGRTRLIEAAQSDGGTDAGAVHPLASRLEMMAACSQAISPRLGPMLGVLLDAVRPPRRGGCTVLRPLWANEAMHRAYSMLHLAAQLHHTAGARLHHNVASPSDRRLAKDLAALFQALDIGQGDERLPCSSVLRGVVRNLVALFGSGAGGVVIRTDIDRLLLPAYKRRALVLAASELAVNALRHGFAGKCGGQIEVTLHAFGTAHTCLTVADDGNGFRDNRPSGQHGIAGALADLLEADLVYRRFGIAGTNAEIVFPTCQRISAVGHGVSLSSPSSHTARRTGRYRGIDDAIGQHVRPHARRVCASHRIAIDPVYAGPVEGIT